MLHQQKVLQATAFSRTLIDKINAGLEKVIASGEYNKIYRKWFGTDAPKLPQ